MYNMLIAEDNMLEMYSLVNYISKKIPDIRICNIMSTGKETWNILKEKVFDVILLDLKLSDSITGIDIIDNIKNNNLEKYKNSVIIYSGDISLLKKIKNNPYIYTFIPKVNGMDVVVENIKKLIEENKRTQYKAKIINKIKMQLEILNFDFYYIGTKYLLETIYEIYTRQDYDNINLKGEIYPIIAKKYHKNVNNIKCNITQAYLKMCERASIDELEDYLHLYLGLKRPKIKDLIISILLKL